jgi:hypothetical protein
VQGVLPRRGRGDAHGPQALGFTVDVLLQFFLQLRLAPASEQQRDSAGTKDVPEPHGSVP